MKIQKLKVEIEKKNKKNLKSKKFQNIIRYLHHFASVLNDPLIVIEWFLKKKSENENSKVKIKKKIKVSKKFQSYELFRHFAFVLNDPLVIIEWFFKKKKNENSNSKVESETVKVKKIKFKNFQM